MASPVTEVRRSAAHPLGIEIRGVSKAFGRVRVLDNVTLSVEAGEFVAIIGPSGCGKTTLLKIVAGLIGPDAGRVEIGGAPVTGPGPDRAMVFQDFALLPWANVLRNVTFGLEVRGVRRPVRHAIAQRVIAKVGLAGFEHHYPHQLSGGMQQRVGLARALAVNPQILLMDEPFASVDEQTRRLLQDDLLALWADERKTVLLVTHSMDEAIYLADRVFVLSPRPGRLFRIIEVDLPRPRSSQTTRASPAFGRLVEDLWGILKDMQ
ncbi:MAG: ABC transporter ATP-binding protein [Armatimonadota bacterium]|nr:ABC transporter ATP-binding protein [Armatimonadota bacterium]MDR7485668.1 ABC transporter ATP-binding protein [Armatimonadota bacterium]MDR7534295.1 ABC transporter ATP-binding protein [Armatimonadota bacterium]MDR7535907.1 ABC transporter ATP-binding protein [Armatimonadota bacterium]